MRTITIITITLIFLLLIAGVVYAFGQQQKSLQEYSQLQKEKLKREGKQDEDWTVGGFLGLW